MKFTESHEWVRSETDDTVIVGVTEFAQKELGDIVYVELPLVGANVIAGGEIAVLESTKAAADIYAPVSGTIVEVNGSLTESPDLINRAPEEGGWICKIRLSVPEELDAMMDREGYRSMLKGS